MDEPKHAGILKATPECFVVQELLYPNAVVPIHTQTRILGPNRKLPVTLFHMVKRDVSTDDALREVARQLNVRQMDIGCHGLKDRRAVTAQCIGVYGTFHPEFSSPSIVLKQVGDTRFQLRPSGHRGNRFTIIIQSDAPDISQGRLTRVRNLFGHQRFGRPQGHEVGKLLLEGDFEKAAKLEQQHQRIDLQKIRAHSHSWAEAFFGPELYRETQFRIMQWQSYLWNTLVREEERLPERVPMWVPEVHELYRDLWNPHSLDTQVATLLHNFDRKTFIMPRNIGVERKTGGWKFRFDLEPGAYATVVLGQVFNLQEHPRTRHEAAEAT